MDASAGDVATDSALRERCTWIDRSGSPGSLPGKRAEFAMAYHGGRKSVFVHGGLRDLSDRERVSLDDMWEWDGARGAWSLIEGPGRRPEARELHALVYDAHRDSLVLVGGFTEAGPVPFADTWEWRSERWTEREGGPEGGPAGYVAGAFDARTSLAVVVEGFYLPAPVVTWEWDSLGSAWVSRYRGTDPVQQALAYDGVIRRVVTLGGLTWSSEAGVWEMTRPPMASSPPEGQPSAVAYGRNLWVVHGRVKQQPFDPDNPKVFSDTWYYADGVWTACPMGEPVPPLRRTGAAMTYDASRDVFVLFGGWDHPPMSPERQRGDLWELKIVPGPRG